MNSLIQHIEKITKRKLTTNELKTLDVYVKQQPLTQARLKKVINYYTQQATQVEKLAQQDTRQMLQDELNTQKETISKPELSLPLAVFLGVPATQLYELSKQLNPKSKLYYQYICFDSSSVAAESTSTRLVWNINDKVPVRTPGTINLQNRFDDVVAMRIGQMSVVHADYALYDAITNSPSNRTAVYFENFGAQRIRGPENNDFHFLLKNNVAAQIGYDMVLSPFDSNRGWFRFYEPHPATPQLILSMHDLYAPSTKLEIKDEFYSFSANYLYTNAIIVSAGYPPREAATIQITEDLKKYLPLRLEEKLYGTIPDINGSATTDPIEFTISGFTTNDPVADAAIIAAFNTTLPLRNLIYSLLNEVQPPLSIVEMAGVDLTEGQLVPITITATKKPRLIGVLELVCLASVDS
jgi:hypothetical protein